MFVVEVNFGVFGFVDFEVVKDFFELIVGGLCVYVCGGVEWVVRIGLFNVFGG